ncbi:hypothetical protein GG804_20730 [Sphingomonas histidinilytica]|uniref:DUF2383 domain-containing protein n=1 Tax=Rhizorhabdus histidinilytica TaxID=439228 RepID=A0A1T5BHL8_9SPHN|nr:hypothetical protein [Rhizorhabdus histidinilytica]MBO9379200.1 hypothetical protein [Rhizorhabdus histidinilytica]SKB46500.1 hypothetical protein SAMN06295920_10317 [Rhizorhabdus histidinilytica]
MDRGDYLDGLRRAYLGELGGAAFARAFGNRDRTPGGRESCALMERLETATARVVEPLMEARPSRDAINKAERRGAAQADRLATWTAFIDHTAHRLDGHVDAFVRLRDAAPAADRPALDLLVGHEIALQRFGTAGLTGDADPNEPLRAAIAAAERHLSAQA